MKYKKVTAIVHANSLEAVEEALRNAGAIELAITHVKGYGDYKNFYSPAWISKQARVEVFIAQPQAQAAVRAISQAAYRGLDSDGIVAVLPVDSLVHIKDWAPSAKP